MTTDSIANTAPTPVNPLAKFFRTPAIYLKLPSNGQYWPDDSLELPLNGEIPVLPMTQKDEIGIRTPDALMNGSAIHDLILSCCPNIKNPWKMPSIDVDAVLVAIRIASYGNSMEISSKCPECKEDNDYSVDLTDTLDRIVAPDYTKPVDISNLQIKLHPQQYFQVNAVNQLTFAQQRLITQLTETEMSDEVRTAELKNHMDKIVESNLDSLTNSTEYIIADGNKVSDPKFIREFYANTESKIVKAIRKRLDAISTEGSVKPVHVTCNHCQHEFDVNIEFDYASFFV